MESISIASWPYFVPTLFVFKYFEIQEKIIFLSNQNCNHLICSFARTGEFSSIRQTVIDQLNSFQYSAHWAKSLLLIEQRRWCHHSDTAAATYILNIWQLQNFDFLLLLYSGWKNYGKFWYSDFASWAE